MAKTSLVPITLPGDPVNPLEAATKAYVDANAGGGGTEVVWQTGAPTDTSVLWADTDEAPAPVLGIAAGGTTGQVLAKNSGTDYDTRWFAVQRSVAHLGPPVQVGLPGGNTAWFGCWQYPATSGVAGAMSEALRCLFVPTFFPRDCTIARVRTNCTTLEVGSTVRIGLYASDEKLTFGSLVADWGTVSGDTTGEKIISGLSTTITAGWYWGAGWFSNHATVRWARHDVTSVNYWCPTLNTSLGRRVWGKVVATVDYSAGLPTNPAAYWTDHVNDNSPLAVMYEATT